eukprot:3945751-Amphidinium_carterae.1
MTRVRALRLPAHVKARVVKFLFSIRLYGAEVGGMSEQRMKDLRASATGALGKGASLRRSAALELMAHGGSTGDPRVVADVSIVRVWQRRIPAGKVIWPFSEVSWEGALRRGRGPGPIRNLRRMADRLNLIPIPDVGGVWHEARVRVAFDFGELCVVSCLDAPRAGRRHPKGRHMDMESRAMAAFPAEVQIVKMKAHQSDRSVDEGRVDRVDLQGSRMADVAANKGTSEHMPLEPSESGSFGALFVRPCVASGSRWVRNCVIVLNNGP